MSTTTSPFQDLDDVLGVEEKALPIGGRLFTFPAQISAETGRLLLRVLEAARENPQGLVDGDGLLADVGSSLSMPDLYAELLGDAQTELAEARVTGDRLAHVVRTLMVWHLYGQDVAAKAWASPGEAPAPNRAARRASSGTAKSTRSRGSTSGTTSPARAPRKAASPGRRSSATGG